MTMTTPSTSPTDRHNYTGLRPITPAELAAASAANPKCDRLATGAPGAIFGIHGGDTYATPVRVGALRFGWYRVDLGAALGGWRDFDVDGYSRPQRQICGCALMVPRS